MRRTIAYSEEFDAGVEQLGGYRAINRALETVIDGLSRNPFAFEKFETDEFSFRYARTRRIGTIPELYVIFTIDADRTVTLQRVEVIDHFS